MKRVTSLLLFLACFLSIYPSNSHFFSIIDGNSGLSQNNVKTIIQDSYGFMWFGTRNKLNRYDGVSIKIFDCYDERIQKGNNNISALFEDPDRQLWIGTDEGVFIFNPVTEKFTAFNLTTDDGTVIVQWVADIRMDQENNIWIMIPNQGVFKYNRDTQKLSLYTVVKDLQPSICNPQCIAIEKNGRVWIGTNGSGVFLYNKAGDNFIQYLGNAENNDELTGKDIYVICHYEDDLLIGIHEGKLMRLNKKRNVISDYPFTEANYQIIRSITLMNDHEVWVGTENGLYIMNEKKQTLEHITKNPLNKYSLSDDFITKTYMDKEGGVWMATHFGGVNYLPARNNTFEKYIPLGEPGSLNSKRIREIREDKKGNIWIGTEDLGVSIFNPKSGTFSPVNTLTYNKAFGMLLQDSKAWVGYFKNGLDLLNLQNPTQVRHYSEKELSLNEASVYTLCEDRFGKVWLGNAWGVFVAEKNSMNFKRMDEFGLIFTFDIMEDSEGFIWVATMGSGVFQYDQEKKILKHFISNDLENSLSSNSVSSITEDHLGRIWFATDRGGISCYNKRTNAFTSYSIAEGLPDDVAYKILEDRDYNLWFGTDKGLVRFNPNTKEIRVFTQNDGLMTNQFNYKSALISSSGKLYFGCLEGLLAFDPEEFKNNEYVPPVYITRFTIHNHEVTPLTEKSPLTQSISHTQKIRLKHDQSTLSFDFVALSYVAPLANTYMYKMENIDKDWINTSNTRSASYAKLPPGKYTFRVKGSNNDGIWNNTGVAMEIEILPVWWQSLPAKVFYFIFISILFYLVIRHYIRRTEKRNKEKQRLFEVEKEKELYESKLGFFTNIAHEIRTPLTLINGPLESIMEMPIQEEELKHNLSLIEQNTKSLLGLINQLLDFRKVDSHKFPMNYRKVNVTELIQETYNQFNDKKILQGKDIKLHLDAAPILAWVDKEGLNKILNNLFTNAIKYSNKEIEIELKQENSFFTLQVSNDGEMIAPELKEKIFEPFFQVKSNNIGSGIGLSLARSLTELQNGTLSYEGKEGKNIFILKLPLIQENIKEDKREDQNPEKQTDILDGTEGFTDRLSNECVLVVEDNQDMLNFIARKLKENYLVEKASNGKEALEILKNKSVSIIVSDLMMPELDGFELCKIVKGNIEYSHIIFIILTAKNDLTSKIQGLELGADAYVEKPFSFQYFSTLLNSLVNNKKRDKELFLQKPFLPIQQVGMNKADEQFMNKATEIINENITNPDFNVERLAELVYMSRSSLHRKFKNLLDLSPIDFIRIIRLKKAAQLIKETGARANEVCYLVGINSPSYFIKLFQKQFGMTPKEFEKSSENILEEERKED